MFVEISGGDTIERDEFLRHLVTIQYARSERELTRGTFRVRGDSVELFPSYSDNPLRVEFFEETLEKIIVLDRESFSSVEELEKTIIFPAKHFVVGEDRIDDAIKTIRAELKEHVVYLRQCGKNLEAERLESRTNYDIEMLQEVGYCSGIENYSRHLSGRAPGSRPYTLIDYFKGDFLLLIDEAHVTIPQVRGMYNGDRARKEMLVEHGFRLPSALDNRPLRFDEFEGLIQKALYVSATPGPYERNKTKYIIEQLIRPTGLLDPEIEVRPADSQIDDLIGEIRRVVEQSERVLVTTLTKRMAEDLAHYLSDLGIRVKYLHSDLDAIERVEILRSLRLREFDCLVGINLLREGLDLPEVSLVAILEADKEGFLRSEVSLIQTAGRAARNVNGRVIMYADNLTNSIRNTIKETERRRKIQMEFNKKHGIIPETIKKAIHAGIEQVKSAKELTSNIVSENEDEYEVKSYVAFLEKRMMQAASMLDFDKAAKLRDDIFAIKAKYSDFFNE
ncbi:helicase-related protein [Candidatus Omnitrophota bacterium]